MDNVQFKKALQKTKKDGRFCLLSLDYELGMQIVRSIEIRNDVSRSQGYKRYFTKNRDSVISRLIRLNQIDLNHRKAYASLAGNYFNIVRNRIKPEESEREDISKILSLEGALAAEQERNSGMPEGERFDPTD